MTHWKKRSDHKIFLSCYVFLRKQKTNIYLSMTCPFISQRWNLSLYRKLVLYARHYKPRLVQLNKYETDPYFLQTFQSNTSVCNWLFPCFVRVANPFVNLKLHLCYITLRIYRNKNKNNFTKQRNGLQKWGKNYTAK